jgi:hypothetical protein
MIHVAEVEHLLAISAQQRRLRDAEIINRAAVVFLMAVWQTYVEALADDAFTHRVSTPSPQKIDALFEKVLGIKAVSQSWKWRGMTADRARRRLEEILALRHQIAHKARVKGQVVRRSTVVQYLHFVHRLAVCLYNTTALYIAKRTGRVAPRRLRYRGRIGELS